MAGQQHPPGGYSQSNAYYGAPQNAQYNNDPPRQYYDAKGPNNQYGSGPPYEPKAQYPATTNINVIPPTGQQYMHPECAMGRHDRKTSYGVCGVILAILFFPFGLICCLLDKEVTCKRCREIL